SSQPSIRPRVINPRRQGCFVRRGSSFLATLGGAALPFSVRSLYHLPPPQTDDQPGVSPLPPPVDAGDAPPHRLGTGFQAVGLPLVWATFWRASIASCSATPSRSTTAPSIPNATPRSRVIQRWKNTANAW